MILPSETSAMPIPCWVLRLATRLLIWPAFPRRCHAKGRRSGTKRHQPSLGRISIVPAGDGHFPPRLFPGLPSAPQYALVLCAGTIHTCPSIVDEGRSQSFESFRRTSSLKLRRCAPASPRWPRSARSPVHWCSGALAGLIFLGCSHAVGAAESGLCLAGEVRRRTSPPGGVGGHLRAARKVRGRRTASNSCPHRLILCAAHTPWSSIRVHRYDYARRGARRRPRPDRAHPRCRRRRRRRPRRPRCRPSRAARVASRASRVTDARMSSRRGRGRLGETPGRLPLGRARPGGHPRPCRRWSWPRRSVSAALIVVCDCVCVLSKKSM